MIIFGTRATVRLLTILNFVCGRCGNPSAHRLEERIVKFTLFFIPLFPVRPRHTFGTCTYCGLVTEIDKPTRERLLSGVEGDGGHGGHQAQGSVPGSPSQPHL